MVSANLEAKLNVLFLILQKPSNPLGLIQRIELYGHFFHVKKAESAQPTWMVLTNCFGRNL